jgi:hypothetical protein
MLPYYKNWHTQEQGMKRISVTVSNIMCPVLHDLASPHHMPMSLYAKLLLFQALQIGPEFEELKKRVDDLHAVVHGFAGALGDGEPQS